MFINSLNINIDKYNGFINLKGLINQTLNQYLHISGEKEGKEKIIHTPSALILPLHQFQVDHQIVEELVRCMIHHPEPAIRRSISAVKENIKNQHG